MHEIVKQLSKFNVNEEEKKEGSPICNVEGMEDLKLYDQLGMGAGGTVYKAVHKATKKKIALKQIPLTTDEKTKISIITELQTLSESKSPYVVSSYGAFQHVEILILIYTLG